MERPTEELTQEHVLVLMVVEAMEREVTSIERTGRAHTERIAQIRRHTTLPFWRSNRNTGE